ncbi:MAG: LamG domain-containing protein [Candidatus Portnoybacteria bacterium]|nr:LamG domain-containing protein [Candidatus Portnoybacteria bacterium]
MKFFSKTFFPGKTRRGALAILLTFLIISVLLVIVLGLSFIFVNELRLSSMVGRTAAAFYAAESGIEHALYQISKGITSGTVSDNLTYSNAEYSASWDATSAQSLGRFGSTRRKVEMHFGSFPPVCGDLKCEDPEETCLTCPGDCGECAPSCGDLSCNGTETCTSCPGDCDSCPLPDEYTKLLIQSHEPADSTIFVDSSQYAHSISKLPGVHHETNEAKFIPSSIFFDGRFGRLIVNDSDDWNFGSGNFTIDAWVNFARVANGNFVTQYTDGSNYFQFLYYSGQLYLEARVSGVNVFSVTPSWTPRRDNWYHIACVRDGSNVKVFVNGIMLEEQTGVSGSVGDFTRPLFIGSDGWGDDFRGYIEELRVSKGVARWTSDFPPPIAPYCSGVCGDGTCDGKETYSSCPSDCPASPPELP